MDNGEEKFCTREQALTELRRARGLAIFVKAVAGIHREAADVFDRTCFVRVNKRSAKRYIDDVMDAPVLGKLKVSVYSDCIFFGGY